jgi:hypothetical protein
MIATFMLLLVLGAIVGCSNPITKDDTYAITLPTVSGSYSCPCEDTDEFWAIGIDSPLYASSVAVFAYQYMETLIDLEIFSLENFADTILNNGWTIKVFRAFDDILNAGIDVVYCCTSHFRHIAFDATIAIVLYDFGSELPEYPEFPAYNQRDTCYRI